jgi:hypothetical protein
MPKLAGLKGVNGGDCAKMPQFEKRTLIKYMTTSAFHLALGWLITPPGLVSALSPVAPSAIHVGILPKSRMGECQKSRSPWLMCAALAITFEPIGELRQ